MSHGVYVRRDPSVGKESLTMPRRATKHYLIPVDSRRSFWNKAIIGNTCDFVWLQSYSTQVAQYDLRKHILHLDGCNSPTTLRHLDSFLKVIDKTLTNWQVWSLQRAYHAKSYSALLKYNAVTIDFKNWRCKVNGDWIPLKTRDDYIARQKQISQMVRKRRFTDILVGREPPWYLVQFINERWEWLRPNPAREGVWDYFDSSIRDYVHVKYNEETQKYEEVKDE